MEGAEHSWVQRLREGDERAASALYRIHAADMLGLATRLLGNEFDADDAVHDAFVRAFDRIDQFHGERFGAWLRQITLNECRLHMRRSRRFLAWRRRAGRQTPASSKDASLPAELAQVHRFLKRLPADERMAWCLQKIEGMTLEEISETVGASLATVKRRIARVNAQLKRWGAE